MKISHMAKLSIVSLLLFCPLFAQLPPRAGRLVVTSDPTGAIIMVNGAQTMQRTNATLVVASGDYKLSVSDPRGGLACSEITLHVQAEETVTRHCTSAGWH